jgi:hypothetical protein
MMPLATNLQPGADRSVRNNQRRSLRIPLSVPMVVSDLRPQGFSECCETVSANSHGCQLRSYRPLATGMQVLLDAVYTNRAARATVIHSEPVGRERGTTVWNCGLSLDKPGNFWNIPSPPHDWLLVNGYGKKDVVLPVAPPDERLPAPGRRTSSSEHERTQILNTIETRIAGLEARVEKATAEFEAGALAQLRQSFGDAIGQARERIKRYSVACGESRLVGLEAEIEQRMAPFLTRSQAATSDLERLLETLRQEHGAWEIQIAQWQQYGKQLQGWLAQETQQLHTLAHDTVIEASGQVKGRIAAIIETACEPLERRIHNAQVHLETQTLSQADELSRRWEANLERLRTVQEEMDRSFRVQLAAQQAEALDLFQQQAKDVMGRAILRMYTTLNDALGSTAQAVQDQTSFSPTQSFGRNGAGSEPTTST